MAKNNDIVSNSDIRTSEKTSIGEKPRGERKKCYVYIGPPIPGVKLMTNMVISGTRGEISEYYKDIVKCYPIVEKLIVPIEKLSEIREKIHTSGNVLNKYYNDLLSQVQKGAVE